MVILCSSALQTHLYLRTNQYCVHMRATAVILMLSCMKISFIGTNPLCISKFISLYCLQNTGTMETNGHGTKLSVTDAYVYKSEVACFILPV